MGPTGRALRRYWQVHELAGNAGQGLAAEVQSVVAKSIGEAARAAANGPMAEVVAKMEALAPTPGQSEAEVHKQLEQLMAHVTQMNAKLDTVGEDVAEVKAAQAAQAAVLTQIEMQVGAMFSGEADMPFRFFVLVPRPSKGYAGMALRAMSPKAKASSASNAASVWLVVDGSRLQTALGRFGSRSR